MQRTSTALFFSMITICVWASDARAQDVADEATPKAASEPPAAEPPAPEPPVPEPPAPEAQGTEQSSADAQADALLAELNATSAVEQLDDGPTLDLYGFVDFTFSGYINNDVEYVDALYGQGATFSVGNINLYAASDLGDGFRSLVEIRFMYLPNGSLDGASGQRQHTAAIDYADSSHPIRWSGILIERAWLEYSAHALLNIRAGQWLTPVGIWNVDHGTPTIISIYRPFAIADGLFPLRQTGIQLHGSTLLGNTTVGYHLTASNGRGNVDEYLDLDTNKGLGARLFASFEPLGRLTLGVSGYTGRATYGDVSVSESAGMPSLSEKLDDQHDELAYAADLLWLYEGLHVQAEVLAQEVVYTDAGRPVPEIPVPGGGFVPDHRRVGMYALLGYRLPWLTLMPYVMYQVVDYGMDNITAPGSIGSGTVEVWIAGLNLRPTPRVTLKALYSHSVIDAAAGIKGGAELDLLAASAAWSF